MNIKEIFRIIKFLWKKKSCIVLDDNLELAQFGGDICLEAGRCMTRRSSG